VTAAAAATFKQIGSKTASGDFAIALASGTAQNPRGVYVAVFAKPRQRVEVDWTMVCSRGTGAGSKSGHYTTTRSTKRKLRMPMANPDSCTASAGGSLSRGGKITVKLYRR
jgi:hypothetical protein